MTIDQDNNIYIVCNFSSGLYQSISFYHDKTLDHTERFEGTSFIIKFDTEGHFVSKYSFNGLRGSMNSIAIDVSKNIYITGYITDSFKDDTVSAKHISRTDVFLFKCDSTFSPVWAKCFGSQSDRLEQGFSLALDNNHENIYVTGSFDYKIEFDNNEFLVDDKNIFLAKYSVDGELVWIDSYGAWSGVATYVEEGRKVIVDDNNNIILAGDIKENFSIGDTIISGVKGGTFLAIFNEFGAFQTLYSVKGYKTEVGMLMTDSRNNVYLGGSFHSVNALIGDYEIVPEDDPSGYIVSLNLNSYNTNINDSSTVTSFLNNSQNNNINFNPFNSTKVYPNPIHSDLNIVSTSLSNTLCNISLYDNLGNLEIHKEINIFDNLNVRLDLGHLTPGYYLLQLSTNEKLETITLIKL